MEQMYQTDDERATGLSDQDKQTTELSDVDQQSTELSEEKLQELRGAYEYYLLSEDAGGLDKKAATFALYYMGHNPTPLQLKEFWEIKRKDEDGVLTFEEFIEFYKTMPEDPELDLMKAFMFFDKNGDRTLDKGEMKLVLRNLGEKEEDLTEEYIDYVLEQIDTNSDGRIDIKEFIKLIQEGGI